MSQWKCSYATLLCYPFHRTLNRVYLNLDRESNVVQIFKSFFLRY